MVDLNALNAIFSVRNGVWSLVMLSVITLWRGWPHIPAIISAMAARRQAIAVEKAADWTRIRDEAKHYADEAHRYAARLDAVEQKVRECEERELAWMRRAIDAEGKLQNEGRLKQELAKIQAADRADPDKAPTSMERFGGEGEGK